MLRLLIVGVLFTVVPALVAAQEGDKPKDEKAEVKAAPATTSDQGGEWELTTWGKIVNAIGHIGVKIGPLVQIVLLCLILIVLLGLRSDINAYIDKTGKGGM